MNEPLTYEDFISQVKAAIPYFFLSGEEDDDFKLNEEYRTANPNFQFKDIEIGKIYAFWDNRDTWFLSPTQIESIDNYFVYWCRYKYHRTGEISVTNESGGEDECERWGEYVWNGRRWKALNTPPFTHETFLNWIQTPWGEIK